MPEARPARRLRKSQAEALVGAIDADDLADVVADTVWWLLGHDDAVPSFRAALAAANLDGAVLTERRRLEALAIDLAELRIIPV